MMNKVQLVFGVVVSDMNEASITSPALDKTRRRHDTFRLHPGF